jgi:hypothetical protein
MICSVSEYESNESSVRAPRIVTLDCDLCFYFTMTFALFS